MENGRRPRPDIAGLVPRDQEPKTTYYDNLRTMVSAGALDIRLVLAPPRTASTLMESSLSRNPVIDAHVHEPFITLRKGDAEQGYKAIYDAVAPYMGQDGGVHLVVKEMSHWLGINNEQERLFGLVEAPPIFLIRNPLLNTESRVKKVIQTLDLREKAAVQERLLDYYATTKGEEKWDSFAARYDGLPDSQVDDEAVRLYRANQRVAEVVDQPDAQLFPLQRWLLDYYAISKGFGRWKEMVKKEFDNRDYKKFGEILDDERIYSVNGVWQATVEQFRWLTQLGREAIIVDSTDFRLEPDTIVPTLCDKWGLPFTDAMIDWGDKGMGLYTGQDKPHQSIWYDRLQRSSRIEPPTEVSPVVEDFPPFIAAHLLTADLPAYVEMFNRQERIKPEGTVLQMALSLPVKKELYKRLRDMGLLPEDMDLKDRQEHDLEVFSILDAKDVLTYSHEEADSVKEAYLQGKAMITLPMQDVDPIFAYLSNPELLDDPVFRQINHRYLPTMEALKGLLVDRTIDPSAQSAFDVGFAQDYLSAAPAFYYEGINVGDLESLRQTKLKLEPLARFVESPREIVSVGVGAGEEVHAAIELLSPLGARVRGLDLSPRALELAQERLAKFGLEADMVLGSATEMPFPDNSIDGIIESAIFHEIYSYVPDGKGAWRKGITEVARKLSEGGVFLLRDFAAPSYQGNVEMELSSEISRDFYNYFREQFRVFNSWDANEVGQIIDRREPNDNEYPPIDMGTNTVVLPFARAAEVMLHFRIFHDRYNKGLITFGDPHWKEINESYLPPNPNLSGITPMPRDEYVNTVLAESNTALDNTEYELVCVQNESSSRPKVAKFFAEHFVVHPEDEGVTSEELLSEVPDKMELVFKKIRKQN